MSARCPLDADGYHVVASERDLGLGSTTGTRVLQRCDCGHTREVSRRGGCPDLPNWDQHNWAATRQPSRGGAQ